MTRQLLSLASLALILLISSIHASQDLRELYHSFLSKYKKPYQNSQNDYEYRFQVFSDNMKVVEELNKKYAPVTKFGVTKFSDLTSEEFQKLYLSAERPKTEEEVREYDVQAASAPLRSANIPTAFDWIEKGAVGPVKSQLKCGSCYSFSAVTALETLNYRITGKMEQYAEQIIVDCDKTNNGCGGGDKELVISWINQNGIGLQKDFPYLGIESQCNYTRSMDVPRWNMTVNATPIPRDAKAIAAALVERGVLMVSLNANLLHHYESGIMAPTAAECDPTMHNHAVAFVSYGTDVVGTAGQTMDWWRIRNSWGEDYGEEGYVRMRRGTNTCGIESWVYSVWH